MFVDHLQLADFRSYAGVDVPLGPGVTIFVGANGQGKTNLVEAIEYLSTMRSHRVSSEVPLVRAGAERAVVRARVQAGIDDTRKLQLEIEITPGKANRARLNRSPLRRSREIVGVLRTVVFSPEDLAIVKGDPSDRRRFIDELLTARWPRMAGVRADYDRVLRQRNTLLKSLSGRSRGGPVSADAASTLEIWDSHLARAGAELLEARLSTLAALAPYVAKAYADIAPTNNDATATYKSSVSPRPETEEAAPVPLEGDEAADPPDILDHSGGSDQADSADRSDTADPSEGSDPSQTPLARSREQLADDFLAALGEQRRDEIQRGVSLVGPHRDDIVLVLGELPAKGYASHGESWSFALALRLGSFQLLRADGVEPVLILDDVFAELDTVRRARLAAEVQSAEQVMVTAAVAADVPAVLQGRRYSVQLGEVTLDE